MPGPPSKPFNRVKTGQIMTIAGGSISTFYGLATSMMMALDSDALVYFLNKILLILYMMLFIGGVMSIVGGIIGTTNSRTGGTIAIVGSIIGGINVITLIGGKFMKKGNDDSPYPTAKFEKQYAKEQKKIDKVAAREQKKAKKAAAEYMKQSGSSATVPPPTPGSSGTDLSQPFHMQWTPAPAPTPTSGNKRCPQCGSELPADARFCNSCGHNF